VALWRHWVVVPAPPLKLLEPGSQAMSPAAAMTGSAGGGGSVSITSCGARRGSSRLENVRGAETPPVSATLSGLLLRASGVTSTVTQ
jgi:hypothetical protein